MINFIGYSTTHQRCSGNQGSKLEKTMLIKERNFFSYLTYCPLSNKNALLSMKPRWEGRSSIHVHSKLEKKSPP